MAEYVYVAEYGEYEDRGIVGIYSSRELALAAYPKDDITVWRLDGGEITVPRWWRVRFNLRPASRSDVEIVTFDEVGERSSEPEALSWPTIESRAGEEAISLTVWAVSKQEARAQALRELQEMGEIPAFEYGVGNIGGIWKKAGTRSVGDILRRFRHGSQD